MRFLVTAGGSREPIDDVRDWGNMFTGATGLAIAQALASAGEVDLLTSNDRHLEQSTPNILTAPFRSHEQLHDALAAKLAQHEYQAVFMTAAVADYRPTGAYAVLQREPTDQPGVERWLVRNVQAGKIKSSHPSLAISGERTPKLVDQFRTHWNYRGLLVKFKLEVGVSRDELIRIGQASRTASGADYLVANTLDMVAGADAGAFLLGEGLVEWVQRSALPARCLNLAIGRGTRR